MKPFADLALYRRLDLESRVTSTIGDPSAGVFTMISRHDRKTQMMLRIIASVMEGWDHVSVSTERRCPTWEEMEQVKRAFFHDHETAMQLHVPPADHINHHPYCLHLWRPQSADIPRPPGWLVGVPR